MAVVEARLNGIRWSWRSVLKLRLSKLQRVLPLVFLAAAVPMLPALSLGLNGAGTVQIISAEGFGPKLQFGGGGSLQLGIPILDWLDLEVSLGILGLAPSDASGGFTYRGLCGGSLGVGAEAFATIGSWERFGRFGQAAGWESPPWWHGTSTRPCISSIRKLERKVSWNTTRRSSLPSALRLSFPVSVQLRRDVDYSVAMGLGLGVSWRFGAAG